MGEGVKQAEEVKPETPKVDRDKLNKSIEEKKKLTGDQTVVRK